MKFWQPGKGPLQKHMQQMREQAQAQWQRNLQGGWWLQQKARIDERLRSNSLTRHTLLSGRTPLSLTDLSLKSSQAKRPFPSKLRTSATVKPSLQLKPVATIRRVWVDHNVRHADQKGMRIHTAFSITNLLRRTGTVAAHFYFDNGVPLKDFNGDYRTKGGNVCVARSFTPLYLNTLFEDLVLFMPYLELHMGVGNHSLKFSVSVWDDRSKELTWSDWVHFTYG
jgi:hypothetical protein